MCISGMYIFYDHFFIKKDTEEGFFHQQGTSRGNELKKISCNLRTCLSREIKYKKNFAFVDH